MDDEHTEPRHAGAAARGAAALLVLSFGPAALALTASAEASTRPQERAHVAPLLTGLPGDEAPPGSAPR